MRTSLPTRPLFVLAVAAGSTALTSATGSRNTAAPWATIVSFN